MENFFTADVVSMSLAFLVYIPILFVPGYVFGWIGDLLGFRGRTQIARFTISVPLSIGICPIWTYLLWRWSYAAVIGFYASCLAAFIALVVWEWRRWVSKPSITRTRGIAVAIAGLWAVVGLFCLVDLQIGRQLYFPTAAYDFTLRAAVTSSITRSGVPPANPYFFPGHTFALRYHYFWLLLCSLIDQFGGRAISARQAMLASNLWAGIGLMASIALWLRFLQPGGTKNLDRRILIAFGLLAVTGLDIIPVAALALSGARVMETIEWWNKPQISAWVTTMLWVPHHLAALIACVTGFLIIWEAGEANRVRSWIAVTFASGFMFASAAGMSIYVTFVFAFFLAVWLVFVVLRNWRRQVALICGAGIVSILSVMPYVLELRGEPSKTPANPGKVLEFTVRSFPIVEALVGPSDGKEDWRVLIADAVTLPLNYFLELGFFAIVAITQFKRMRRGDRMSRDADLCALVMVVTSVLICTFVRSSVIANNDLGRRGLLPAQFVLLIWGAGLWDGGFIRRRALITAMLVLGVGGSLYELTMVRFYPVLSDIAQLPRSPWLSVDHELGKRTYALRDVYERLGRELPVTAVVQHNPNGNPGDIAYGLYADRQAAAETQECGVVFGGNADLCSGIVPRINGIFSGDVRAADIDGVCRSLSIDALVVKDTDLAWAQKDSWVWNKQPVFANDHARAYLCATAARH
jgi:hypothetical protein